MIIIGMTYTNGHETVTAQQWNQYGDIPAVGRLLSVSVRSLRSCLQCGLPMSRHGWWNGYMICPTDWILDGKVRLSDFVFRQHWRPA